MAPKGLSMARASGVMTTSGWRCDRWVRGGRCGLRASRRSRRVKADQSITPVPIGIAAIGRGRVEVERVQHLSSGLVGLELGQCAAHLCRARAPDASSQRAGGREAAVASSSISCLQLGDEWLAKSLAHIKKPFRVHRHAAHVAGGTRTPARPRGDGADRLPGQESTILEPLQQGICCLRGVSATRNRLITWPAARVVESFQPVSSTNVPPGLVRAMPARGAPAHGPARSARRAARRAAGETAPELQRTLGFVLEAVADDVPAVAGRAAGGHASNGAVGRHVGVEDQTVRGIAGCAPSATRSTGSAPPAWIAIQAAGRKANRRSVSGSKVRAAHSSATRASLTLGVTRATLGTEHRSGPLPMGGHARWAEPRQHPLPSPARSSATWPTACSKPRASRRAQA